MGLTEQEAKVLFPIFIFILLPVEFVLLPLADVGQDTQLTRDTGKKEQSLHKSQFEINMMMLMKAIFKYNFYLLLYSSSVTGFNQFTTPFSGFILMAMWVKLLVGEAPCQCSTPGNIFTTSPA